MKITKDIEINILNLSTNSYITINYFGKLNNISEKIFIHYGYTPNNFEYKKLELNNKESIKINLEQPGYFYFYFSNENKNIDNNNSKDYQLYIKTSNLILTDNSSMNELPYRYSQLFNLDEKFYKTFYTSQTIKNTSKPQEIILPRPFNIKTVSSETKNLNGYYIEPVKPLKEYNVSQALISTENNSFIEFNSNNKNIFRKFKLIFNKLLLTIPKLFGKDFS